jgi:hypothetical protein
MEEEVRSGHRHMQRKGQGRFGALGRARTSILLLTTALIRGNDRFFSFALSNTVCCLSVAFHVRQIKANHIILYYIYMCIIVLLIYVTYSPSGFPFFSFLFE